MADDKTIGEVYRLVEGLKEDHGKKLDDIDTQVRLTNGRTTKLEVHVETLKSEVRSLKHHHQYTAPPTPPALLPAPIADGESLSIKVSPKMWRVLAGAGGALFVMLVEWLRHQMGTP